MLASRPSGKDLQASATAVIVLGAGFGSRFGGDDKLGMALGGMPVAHHILSALQPFGWGRKILVCRHRAVWTSVFRDQGFDVIRNDDPQQGMLSSLRRGALAARDLSNVLVCLADMPFVGSRHLARLLFAAGAMSGRVIASRADDYRGPPAIIPVGDLLRLPASGEGGARSLLADAAFIDCERDELLDIDTHQDLEVAKAHLLAGKGH